MKCEYKSNTGVTCCRDAIGMDSVSEKPYCIFHMPCNHPNKKRDEFINALKDEFHTITRWEMDGFCFPGISLPKGEFPDPGHTHFVNLSNAIFEGYVDFTGAHFRGVLLLSDARFDKRFIFKNCVVAENLPQPHVSAFDKCPIDFTDVEFIGHASFDGSLFHASTSFSRAHFHSGVSFCGECKFIDTLLFEGVKVEKEASFLEAEFHKRCSFNGSSFRGVSYALCKFLDKSMFDNAHFYPKLDGSDAPTSFVETEFHGESNFFGSEFCVSTSFQDARYMSHVSFRLAQFQRASDFCNCAFLSADFNGTFFNIVDWRDAEFRGVLALHNIRPFQKCLKFLNLRTQSEVTIQVSNLLADNGNTVDVSVLLQRCILESRFSCTPAQASLNLNNCTFLSDVRIDPTLDPDFDIEEKGALLHWSLYADLCHFCSATTIAYPRVVSLQECYIDTELLLQNADMKRAGLRGTDCSKIRFDNVKWNEIDRSIVGFGSLSRSKALYCEFEIRRKRRVFWKESYVPAIKEALRDSRITTSEVHDLVMQYRGIARSFELREDFATAGTFKAADFDLRRRSKENSSWIERLVLRMYRVLAAYGESIMLPLTWLLLFVCIFGVCYIFLGIPLGIIEGDKLKYSFSAPNENPIKLAGDLVKVISYSISNCIPGGISNSPRAIPGFLSLLTSMQKFLSWITLATLIFAIRRKLKR